MLATLLALPIVQTAKASTLFGPVSVSFQIPFEGDPYDPAANDVRVRFSNGKQSFERLAYFSGGNWKVTAALPLNGSLQAIAYRNGKKVSTPQAAVVPRTKVDFVAKQGKWFRIAGKPYWPIGINTAWGNQRVTVEQDLVELAKSGGNWARVWACHWDGRNPFWVVNSPAQGLPATVEPALNRWDSVIRTAELQNIKFQMVLQHHGQYSTQVNPNWGEHPWNTKNGGFLNSPAEFFDHPEAIRRTKNFYRLAIARFGASPSIMAWELFNEVQFVDRARIRNDWATVGKWHNEMARFIRSLDPYPRLITTSSELEAPIWSEMDYKQGHGYPTSVEGMLMGTPNNEKIPMFFGEVGPDSDAQAAHEVAIKDGIWGGFFALHSGAGQYWYWDKMNPLMRGQLQLAKSVLSSLPPVEKFSKSQATVQAATGGDLVAIPGRGWGKSDQTEFVLPNGLAATEMGKLSGYLQGAANRKLQPGPWTFSFTAETAGEVQIRFAEVSTNGGKVVVRLNQQEVLNETITKASDLRSTRTIRFEPGAHYLEIQNTGEDWVRISQVKFTKIGPAATSTAVQSGNTTVFRVRRNLSGAQVKFVGTKGKRILIYSLDAPKTTPIFTASFDRQKSYVLPASDQIVIIR